MQAVLLHHIFPQVLRESPKSYCALRAVCATWNAVMHDPRLYEYVLPAEPTRSVLRTLHASSFEFGGRFVTSNCPARSPDEALWLVHCLRALVNVELFASAAGLGARFTNTSCTIERSVCLGNIGSSASLSLQLIFVSETGARSLVAQLGTPHEAVSLRLRPSETIALPLSVSVPLQVQGVRRLRHGERVPRGAVPIPDHWRFASGAMMPKAFLHTAQVVVYMARPSYVSSSARGPLNSAPHCDGFVSNALVLPVEFPPDEPET